MRRLLKRFVQSGWTYDLVQRLAGDRQLQRRLAPHLERLPVGSRVVDIGGGTGLPGHYDVRYICLDLDLVKLRRFRAKYHDRLALAADATRCPFLAGMVDAVVCVKVTHHLTDTQLTLALAEAGRIVKPGGTLILADAIRSGRLLSALLWRFDRGSHPRTADAIARALSATGFEPGHSEQFRVSILHDFLLCIARRSRAAGTRERAG